MMSLGKAGVFFTACMMLWLSSASASVFLPYKGAAQQRSTHSALFQLSDGGKMIEDRELRWALRRHQFDRQYKGATSSAMAIPGYGVAEQVFVGGFGNFLSIYNLLITARILLSWFPQAQSVGALQPLYSITDPFLNLFRGVVPPLFGLDFSPILAFVLLNVLGSATAAVGYEITPEMQEQFNNQKKWGAKFPLAPSSSKSLSSPAIESIAAASRQRAVSALFGSSK